MVQTKVRILTPEVAAVAYAQKSKQPFISVDDYVQTGDTGINQALQRSVSAATSFGIKRILLNQASYTANAGINLAGVSGLVISGSGTDATKITVSGNVTNSAPLDRLFYNSAACSDITIEELTIEGTIVDDVTGPRRSRINSGGPGLNCAVLITGSNNPTSTGRGVVRNVRLRHVKIRKTNSLPFLFDGVIGYAQALDVETYLTMDGGWIYCETVAFDALRSYKSADNGYSISRGNSRVLGGSVYAEMCAYFGFWLAGFYVSGDTAEAGPQHFNVDTITSINTGKSGVALIDAPRNGRIGSIYVNGVARGPSDQPTDLTCVGIQVGSYPSNNLQAPQIYAQNMLIESALLINCSRGGVALSGATDINYRDIVVINAGTQYLADGTTVIPSTSTTQNFGVAVEAGAETTVTRLSVRGLRVIDNRAIPYTNYPLYTTGSVSAEYSEVSAYGTRQTTLGGNVSESIAGTKIFSGNTKLTGGATTGSNAGTGTLSGLDFNGAATSIRKHQFQTAGVRRWLVGTDGSSESGSNAGSRFTIDSYDDSGTLIKSMLSLSRDGKIGFAGQNPIAPPSVGAVATDVSTTQTLVNNVRAALIQLGLAVV